MRVGTDYKINRLSLAIKSGEKPDVMIRGENTPRRVTGVTRYGHTVELTLDRNRGFLLIDPDEVLSVTVRSRPAADR